MKQSIQTLYQYKRKLDSVLSNLYLTAKLDKLTEKKPMSRIVLETTDQQKQALMESLNLQGNSLTDWFEEQFAVTHVNRARNRPPADELTNPAALNNPSRIFERIAELNWAFTDDDTRYLTHDLHPYPAKFIPQIPANLISMVSLRGDLVFDPFGGSGTTAVEAVRMGRRAVSLDANPISALIGRVKTGFMTRSIRIDLERLIAATESHALNSDLQIPNWNDSQSTRLRKFVPDIPNIEKWFEDQVVYELALLRFLIEETTSVLARDAALLALSRIVIRVSNQESETRYVSVKKSIPPLMTLRVYLESLRTVIRRLEIATMDLQYADARFLVGDTRKDVLNSIGENSVDLIVTSPPYPNATDYHLYHRFRLFWLGYDPRELGRIEIGSHLRHQRNDTGFEEYRRDMKVAVENCAEVLQSGRYAVFVLGDALFKGKFYATAEAIAKLGREAGFDVIGIIDRPLHKTKRSFTKPGRRARTEQLVLMRKPNSPIQVNINPPPYKMWKFEQELRRLEISQLLNVNVDTSKTETSIILSLKQPALWNLRRLAFSKDFCLGRDTKHLQSTWQSALENGDAEASRRKDPKYVTHGLHPFKGKFYPQLAKAILNITDAPLGGRVFDPFCGSGTFILEGMLNGFIAYGCDYNPLSAKITTAKTSILLLPREIVDLAIRSLLNRVIDREVRVPDALDQFPSDTHRELMSWFPVSVLHKINWLLSQIRVFGNPALIDFFEVIVSSLIREVSHQDPADLRIRRRKTHLEDAPVFDLFCKYLQAQHARLIKYWSVAGRQPGTLHAPIIRCGDARKTETLMNLSLASNSVDCVVTSPPYATALPYIDTDRLSLLATMGITSRRRAELEKNLTGSREISRAMRTQLEEELHNSRAEEYMPKDVVSAIRTIDSKNKNGNVGFRRANMAALLWRYFVDIRENLIQVGSILKPGAQAIYIVGDGRTKAGGEWVAIETCDHLITIGKMTGLMFKGAIPIDVTTENYRHIKNAITHNQILIFEKY